MINFTSFKNFEKPDGSGVDWKAYSKAQLENGEICTRCRAYCLSLGLNGPSGYPDRCYDCKKMDVEKGEVTHGANVRCPKCSYQWNIISGDNYEYYADGLHDAQCRQCEYEFEITTYVSYSFKSPALLPEEPEAEKTKEEGDDDGEEERPVEEVPPPGPKASGSSEGEQPSA